MSSHPTHIGIVADGNRRWAKDHGLPTLEGHKRGSKVVEMIIEELQKTDVRFVSFFVFSTENWNRSPEEINYLMSLIASEINRLAKKAQKNNLRIAVIGKPDRVDPELWQEIMATESSTQHNTGLTVCFCFNYGGQWEIVGAAKRLAEANDTDYTPENFHQYLYHPEVPDCDMIVRTSGEERLSGFMLWRAAYAELLFLQKHFPELTKQDVQDILTAYSKRQRRFGK